MLESLKTNFSELTSQTNLYNLIMECIDVISLFFPLSLFYLLSFTSFSFLLPPLLVLIDYTPPTLPSLNPPCPPLSSLFFFLHFNFFFCFSSSSYFSYFEITSFKDQDFQVRQFIFSFLGELANNCPRDLIPYIPKILPCMINNIYIVPSELDPSQSFISICNNAVWYFTTHSPLFLILILLLILLFFLPLLQLPPFPPFLFLSAILF